MPYRSFRRNTFRRRFRYRSRLSNRNIYSNRSARSQAVQIAALRNRVNKVYRACKPEKKVRIGSVSQYNMSSESSGNISVSMAALSFGCGTTRDTRIGNKVYRKDTYYITFEYYNNSDTGYHSSESSGTSIRIICGQWKELSGATTVPTLTELISNYGTSGAPSTISAVAPLTDGVTADYNIFKDFNIKLTTDSNQKLLKVTTPWYLCRFSDYTDGAESDHSFLWVVSNGLHWDTNFKEYVLLTGMRKTVFKDA